jgi:hypothetical protein
VRLGLAHWRAELKQRRERLMQIIGLARSGSVSVPRSAWGNRSPLSRVCQVRRCTYTPRSSQKLRCMKQTMRLNHIIATPDGVRGYSWQPAKQTIRGVSVQDARTSASVAAGARNCVPVSARTPSLTVSSLRLAAHGCRRDLRGTHRQLSSAAATNAHCSSAAPRGIAVIASDLRVIFYRL